MMLKVVGMLPLLGAWLGYFGLARELAARGRLPTDWRVAWMCANLAWGATLTLIVEGSSLVRSLDGLTVFISWCAVCLITGLWFRKLRLQRAGRCEIQWRTPFDYLAGCWNSWTLLERAIVALIALFIGALGIVAAATPTTNWDSLTYHLARCCHWIQNQGVQHYQTGNLRQLEFAPWNSFALTTLMLLTEGDQWVNLLQWFAMLSSVIGITFIAEQLANRTEASADPEKRYIRPSILAALLLVTLPIGFLESINTQNDYLVSYWLLSFVTVLILWHKNPENRWYAPGCGLAAGLGVLTKSTFFLYATPWVFAAAVWACGRIRPWSLLLRMGAVVLCCFVVLNASHMYRNFSIFTSPLGSIKMQNEQRNQVLSAKTILSHSIRALALHTNTGIKPVTDGLNAVLRFISEQADLDLNDPRISFPIGHFNFKNRFEAHDSSASGPLHVFLVLGGAVIAVWQWKRRKPLLVYLALLGASVFVFLLLLSWQEWEARFHLAFFVLALPAISVVWWEGNRPIRWLGAVAVLLACVYAAATVAVNRSRPIRDREFWALSREEKHLAVYDRGSNESLIAATEALVRAGHKKIGLKIGFDYGEYPIWVMLRNRGFQGRIDHVYVKNESWSLPSYRVDAILASSTSEPPDYVRKDFPYTTVHGSVAVHWRQKP